MRLRLCISKCKSNYQRIELKLLWLNTHSSRLFTVLPLKKKKGRIKHPNQTLKQQQLMHCKKIRMIILWVFHTGLNMIKLLMIDNIRNLIICRLLNQILFYILLRKAPMKSRCNTLTSKRSMFKKQNKKRVTYLNTHISQRKGGWKVEDPSISKIQNFTKKS